MAHLFGRRKTDAVPSRPAVHLALRAAAEPKQFRPRHFVQMVHEHHQVGDEFQPFIQTAVRLDVQVFSVLVRNVEQLLRVAVYRAAIVDFKLYVEMPQTFAMENKVWCIAVFVDDLAVLIPAGRAVSVVVTVPRGRDG